MKNFKSGDVVILKSGSNNMTLRKEDPNYHEYIWCDWFLNGEAKSAKFLEDQLEMAVEAK